MADPRAADNDVERYYDANAHVEWERLTRDRTEFALTTRALRDHLPRPPAAVLDIGGGPGRYAIELARAGYDVTLADISQAELDVASVKAQEAGVPLRAVVRTDARDLSQFGAGTFRAALMLGPLYHLLDAEDRARAVSEARRVVRDGGLIFAAFITRYAALRFWAKFDPVQVVRHLPVYERLIASGQGPRTFGFTDVYFAHPAEVRPLLEGAGFETLDLIGCEGVISMISEKIDALSGEEWETWMDLNYRLGRDPSTHGIAEHLLYVGRRR